MECLDMDRRVIKYVFKIQKIRTILSEEIIFLISRRYTRPLQNHSPQQNTQRNIIITADDDFHPQACTLHATKVLRIETQQILQIINIIRMDFFLSRDRLCMSFCVKRPDNLLHVLPNSCLKKKCMFSHATKVIFHSNSLTIQYILKIRIRWEWYLIAYKFTLHDMWSTKLAIKPLKIIPADTIR